MRIAYVTEVDLSIDNGPGINEREFVRALLNLSPDAICVVPEPSQPDIFHDSRLHYVRVNGSSRLRKYLGFARGAMDRLNAEHKEAPLQGVGVRIGILPILPIMVRRSLGIPVFLKTLAGYGLMGPDAELRFRLLAPALRPLYRNAIRASTAADTASIAYIEWLSYMFGAPPYELALIPNGANTDFFRPGERRDARKQFGLDRFSHVVGYVGALHGWRDLTTLVESFAAADLPSDAGLVLVGSGPRRALIEARVEELGIRDKVVLTGQIPYANVPALMRTFDVAVDLTVIAMQVGHGEALGSYSQKIPQYLSVGIPVITWGVPDTAFLDQEMIGKTALYRDRAALSQAIEQMVLLPDDVATAYSRRARGYAERMFSARSLAARRLDLWRTAIAGVGERRAIV